MASCLFILICKCFSENCFVLFSRVLDLVDALETLDIDLNEVVLFERILIEF